MLECTQRDVEPVRKQIPVLIVEDEVLIRMHLVDILDHEGFTTVEVDSVSEGAFDSMIEGRPDIRVVIYGYRNAGNNERLGAARITSASSGKPTYLFLRSLIQANAVRISRRCQMEHTSSESLFNRRNCRVSWTASDARSRREARRLASVSLTLR